jgi:predicted adenine nucleotide alpha hydrolase (AANH) superfamily ATPase
MLSERFEVAVYFDNSNIQPEEEYRARLLEIRELAARWGFSLVEAVYDPGAWFSAVRGYEDQPEGSRRCEICYGIRLNRTALRAVELGMDWFATTLSISPHKKADLINRIGGETAEAAGIRFLECDFKKKDGFRISCELSRAEGLYRQNYCGCIYSRRSPVVR